MNQAFVRGYPLHAKQRNIGLNKILKDKINIGLKFCENTF